MELGEAPAARLHRFVVLSSREINTRKSSTMSLTCACADSVAEPGTTPSVDFAEPEMEEGDGDDSDKVEAIARRRAFLGKGMHGGGSFVHGANDADEVRRRLDLQTDSFKQNPLGKVPPGTHLSTAEAQSSASTFSEPESKPSLDEMSPGMLLAEAKRMQELVAGACVRASTCARVH